MLLPTSPLRLAADIDGAVRLFRVRNATSVVSVVDLNKYMTNLRFIEDEHLIRVSPKENPNAQRQDVPKLYAVNGSIFLARTEVLRMKGTFHVDGTLAYIMKDFNSIDINSLGDLRLARMVGSTFEPWSSWFVNI